MNQNGNGNWNGNNNGQQWGGPPQQPQGYGQQQQPQGQWGGPPQGGYGGGYQDDVYGRMNNAREVQQRDPFIEAGSHRLVVLELQKWDDQQKGPSVRVTFEYVASTDQRLVGTRGCKIWRLTKPAKFQSQTTDGEHFADFVRKAKNAPLGTPLGQEIRNLCESQQRGGNAEANAMRGTLIDCVGSPNKKGDYVNLFFTAVAQGPQDIAAKRQQLDTRLGGAPAQGPAPQQMQAPQGQPQQGYVPQGAPVQPPQQGMQYAQQPQQGYAQQNQAPQGAPQQGGFLAQIPGWQGGGQGNGNGQ